MKWYLKAAKQEGAQVDIAFLCLNNMDDLKVTFNQHIPTISN